MRSFRPDFAAAVALVSTLAAGVPAANAQAPESTLEPATVDVEPIRVFVGLVTTTLPKSLQTAAAEELERQLDALVDAHGLERAAEREAASLYLRLELNQPDASAEVYLVHVVAVYEGEVIRREDARACIACTPTEMVEDGLRAIPRALSDIDEQRAAAEEAAAAAELEQDEPPAPVVSDEPFRPIGALGYVGISASALGLGTAIAGAVLLDRGLVDPTGTYLEFVDYKTPGKALIGAGLGLMVVGNVLLAVDLTVLAQRRREAQRARVDGISLTTQGGPGVMVRGRF